MSVLRQLAEELEINEDALRDALVSSDETLTPNYLTQAEDGGIGANFSGHISAAGLDFTAWTHLFGTPETPALQRSTHGIRWSADTALVPGGPKPWEGALLAEIYTEDIGGYGNIHLSPYAGPGATGANPATVWADIYRVIDGNGRSDFYRMTDWVNAVMGGAFNPYGGVYAPPSYRVTRRSDGVGEVRMRGLVAANQAFGSGYAICQGLPAPQYDEIFNGLSQDNSVVRLNMRTDGNLYYGGTIVGPTSNGAGAWISIGQVCYGCV